MAPGTVAVIALPQRQPAASPPVEVLSHERKLSPAVYQVIHPRGSGSSGRRNGRFVRVGLPFGVPVGVYLREVSPLFRKVFSEEYRGHRANRYAHATVN